MYFKLNVILSLKIGSFLFSHRTGLQPQVGKELRDSRACRESGLPVAEQTRALADHAT